MPTRSSATSTRPRPGTRSSRPSRRSRVVLSADQFDSALQAVADFVDLKSPYTLGHARAVAELAAATGEQLGLPTAELTALRRAAVVHSLGRLGVSNSIWDKSGPLGAGEWERVRMYPYLTERMLCQSEVLAPLGAIAVQHRERLDGSGYPRGLSGNAISRPARYWPSPTRTARCANHVRIGPRCRPSAAATELQADVRAGRLDHDAVGALLVAAGHQAARRQDGPAGLTRARSTCSVSSRVGSRAARSRSNS